MKFKSENYNAFLIYLTFFIIFFNTEYLIAQGRFLRGEIYKEYNLENKTADFYVSTKGNDNWSGKLAETNAEKTDGPFATIERARIAVRELKQKIYKEKLPPIEKRFIGSPHKFGSGNDILVLLREGIYSIDSSITFSEEDGGERVETDLPTGAFEYHKLKDYFVTYASYPGENAVISGGKKITNWSKAKNGIWRTRINLSKVNELYVNGKRQTLARAPNKGFFNTAGIPTDSSSFNFYKGDLKNWENLSTNNLTMFVRWGTVFGKISKIDEVNNIAYLEKPNSEIMIIPPKYFIDNVESILDTAGEWFYNNSKNILSFFPSDENSNLNEADVYVPYSKSLIKVVGKNNKPIRNLRFYNLEFSTTSFGGNATLDLSYANNCEIINCKINNVGQTPIKLGLGSYKNMITKNKIMNFEGSGIELRGAAKPESWNDMVYDNTISYNEIEGGEYAHMGIGASNTLRTEITHNYVSNVGSYGLAVGSWPNVEESSDGSYLIEYNHVEYATMLRDDEGGIAVFGLSPGSIVRNNLVHDVRPAPTNENVGFFFQNMSKGWDAYDNIYYNLKQAEMKLCAAYITDNIYESNFVIEKPINNPEKIILGNPKFSTGPLKLNEKKEYLTGEKISIKSEMKNTGSTGIEKVNLYIDGKIVESKKFPIISNNSGTIEFIYQFYEPGKHRIAINESPELEINVKGESLKFVVNNLSSSMYKIPLGENVIIKSAVQNIKNAKQEFKIELLVDNKIAETKLVNLSENKISEVNFSIKPNLGKHKITIGNYEPIEIEVYKGEEQKISDNDLSTFCTTTAQPCNFNFAVNKNVYEIEASGTDFLHAEDSYGTIYLNRKIKGNFIAVVKVQNFGEGVSEWFRAGLFVRNDITKSNVDEIGCKGSFLVFSTPKRNGAQWDEFADGSMHNTKSFNYEKKNPFPVWLKLIRDGNKFISYFSYDQTNWEIVRDSPEIKDLAKSINIGIAGGTNDRRPSKVFFESLKIVCEENQ